MSPLNPISSGEVYTVSYLEFKAKVSPTTRLNDSHPFHRLWRSLLVSLTDGCDSFWDSIMKIYTGQTAFARSRAEKQRFKTSFLNNPPNIAIADMQSIDLYGRHSQTTHLWNFIFISKVLVDTWANAGDETTALGYEALLKGTLVHESAHWVQTLRVGLYPPLTQDQASQLSSSQELKLKKKLTPKCFRTFEAPNACGEAGYYVELAVFGGILSLDDDKLIIWTSKTSANEVHIHETRKLREFGLCSLVPLAASLSTPQPPSPTPFRDCQGALAMLCDSDDDDKELSFPSCPREYPVLDHIAATCFKDDDDLA